MNTAYLKLKGKFKEFGLTHKDIAKKINKSQSYIAERMAAKENKYFNEIDIYNILSLIEEPYENMGLYFNKNQRYGR